MHWRTKLIHAGVAAPKGFKSLVPAVERGSTVVFENQAAALDDWRQDQVGYTYGLYGSPTVLELAARIAALEGARHTFIVPAARRRSPRSIWPIARPATTP
jgi:cystathionine beta-lyase